MFRRVPTQGSAWAGFDLSGMSPLGGGGTTPGKRSATIGVGAILDRKRYVGVADGNAVQLAAMGALKPLSHIHQERFGTPAATQWRYRSQGPPRRASITFN